MRTVRTEAGAKRFGVPVGGTIGTPEGGWPTTPHLRTSERVAFKHCIASHQWRYRDGLVPRTRRPDALWFGTGIHLALQHRYSKPGLARGKNVLGVWRDYVGDEVAVIGVDPGTYDVDAEKYVNAKELGEEMLGAYLDKYGMDERWWVISAEQTFELPIPMPLTLAGAWTPVRKPGEPLTYYNGTFDLVARDQEGYDTLWLWDHKTAATINTDHLSLDDQAGSYWAVAGDVLAAQGLVEKGDKIEGILYNYLRKGKRDQRPVNAAGLATNKPLKAHYIEALRPFNAIPLKPTMDSLAAAADSLSIEVLGDVSKVQPAALFHREIVARTRKERRTQIRKIQDEALHIAAVDARLLPVTKTPTTKCKFCPFFNMCELQDSGDDWTTWRDQEYTTQDPYADHRVGGHHLKGNTDE